MLDGSIASLGSQYVLGLKAVNCRTGETLAEVQTTADRKEQVLKSLSEAAANLRGKLGESLSTVRKFDTPIEQATTPSLEALQDYSLGLKAVGTRSDPVSAIPFLQKAVELDPNFASAYAFLGISYADLGESEFAMKSLRKAFELRERTTERERFPIEIHYYDWVNGNLEKARQASELWAEVYPQDPMQSAMGSETFVIMGQYEKVIAGRREAAAEFQKILDHPGVVVNEPIGALAHLGLARAYAMQAAAEKGADAGNTYAKARAAYRDFLALWKNADPGIPVLKQAKREYASLR